MVSADALRLKHRPESMIVIGGGYIGMELGQFYAATGTKVTVLEYLPTLLSLEDREIAASFTHTAAAFKNMHVVLNARIARVETTADGEVRVCMEDGSVMVGDTLLVATGVQPNSDLLDLEATNVAVNNRGFVVVDDHLRTTEANVWAAGDIVGNYMFRHSANFEGAYLFATALVEEVATPIDYPAIPHCVFTSPQVAGVGLKEHECTKQGASFVVGRSKYNGCAMGKALRLPDDHYVKMIVERGSRCILGCHLIGYEASTLLHQVTCVVTKGGCVDDLLTSITVHPALNEVVRDAARSAVVQLRKAGDSVPVMLSFL